MPFDTATLERETHTYWTSLTNAGEDSAARGAVIDQEYIDGLLRKEVEHAKERALKQEGVWPREHACVLVLLVGHSIEPLLQTICAYQPCEVVLVLNSQYGKKNKQRSGERFACERVIPRLEALRQLKQPLLDAPFKKLRYVWPQPEQGSKPGDIFRLLLKELREETQKGKNIVIDITGGKKSMVAGAYFFAAYTNAKISYVDFDDYHELQRRPYGFSCQIGLLPNPYEIFGLRDWEQVKSLYERFFFDEAVKKLCIIAKDMSLEYFNPEQIIAVETLIKIMRVYHAWSIGDYVQAKTLSDQVKELKPLASVEALHSEWLQNIDDAKERKTFKNESWDFYSNHELVLQYALDECAKVDRIVKLKEDYRSGLLRAAGLNEVLLKARLAVLWQRNELTLFDNNVRMDESKTKHAIADGAKGIKAYFAEDILRGENEMEIYERYGSRKALKKKDALLYMKQSREILDILTKDRDLRNDIIHFVIPVSKQTAEEAVDVMQKNVEDFEQVWVKSLSPHHTVKRDTLPTWEELCGWCNIDFLLHPKKQEKQS